MQGKRSKSDVFRLFLCYQDDQVQAESSMAKEALEVGYIKDKLRGIAGEASFKHLPSLTFCLRDGVGQVEAKIRDPSLPLCQQHDIDRLSRAVIPRE